MPESSSEYISDFVRTLLPGASAEELRDAQDNLDRVLDFLDELCEERAQRNVAYRQDDKLRRVGTVSEAQKIMKRFFAYIRVSTVKQGEKGSSLQEQHAAIEGYAKRHGLLISEWFEERETAAKRGRPAFTAMLARLRKGDADGVVIHKIDRGARNLRDWADLGELIDAGIELHFANESLDLHTRGGRLSADIQAVVAADYVRNLKEEVRKGFYGRLKQGVYPLPAPIGYRNEGKGKPKSLDPVTAPLVRLAFDLYGEGRYTLNSLCAELNRRGLRSRRGTRLRKSTLSEILNNEFYLGIMHVKRTNERFEGKHPPLIPRSLFVRVQTLLHGKVKHRGWKHDLPYRQTLHCAGCGRFLIGERQKGHVYYRCQNSACKGVSVREDRLHAQIGRELGGLRLTPSQLIVLREHVKHHQANKIARHEEATAGAQLLLAQLEQRRARLTDAYIERVVDKEAYEARNKLLLDEKASLRERIRNLEAGDDVLGRKVAERLELLSELSLSRETENLAPQRDFLLRASSNLRVRMKELVVDWLSPFDVLAKAMIRECGGPERDRSRTESFHAVCEQFLKYEATECDSRGSLPRKSDHESGVDAV